MISEMIGKFVIMMCKHGYFV